MGYCALSKNQSIGDNNIDYIETDNVIGVFVDNINDKIRQYQEMKRDLEDSIMNILGVNRKYFL